MIELEVRFREHDGVFDVVSTRPEGGLERVEFDTEVEAKAFAASEAAKMFTPDVLTEPEDLGPALPSVSTPQRDAILADSFERAPHIAPWLKDICEHAGINKYTGFEERRSRLDAIGCE